MFSRAALSRSSHLLLRARPSLSAARPVRPLAPAPALSPTPALALAALLRRHLSAETRSAIQSAISSAPVVLFMKGTPAAPQCGFSRASVQILGLQGVDPARFAAFNVLEDEELRQGVKEFSEWPTIPQLYVRGEFVGGCDILVAMHQDGSLAKLLEEKDVLATEEEESNKETPPV